MAAEPRGRLVVVRSRSCRAVWFFFLLECTDTLTKHQCTLGQTSLIFTLNITDLFAAHQEEVLLPIKGG